MAAFKDFTSVYVQPMHDSSTYTRRMRPEGIIHIQMESAGARFSPKGSATFVNNMTTLSSLTLQQHSLPLGHIRPAPIS